MKPEHIELVLQLAGMMISGIAGAAANAILTKRKAQKEDAETTILKHSSFKDALRDMETEIRKSYAQKLEAAKEINDLRLYVEELETIIEHYKKQGNGG